MKTRYHGDDPMKFIDDIASAIHRDRYAGKPTWENENIWTKGDYRRHARAALRAMSVPTEEMLAAADSAIPSFSTYNDGTPSMTGRDGALEVWQTMLKVATASQSFPDD